MSHFTRVKSRIFDRVALEAALQDLNHRISPISVINGWQGAARKADMVAKTSGPYDIGFVKAADGSYDIVADWWGVRTTTGIEQERFVNQLTQRYAYRKVMSEVAAHGFEVTEQEACADSSIRVAVRKW